ncbi:DUF3316 domain-containing protein [Psychromonas sp. PT13]|uniref:DUF3316 domain-containing protein n=1 Tax=Psychromonas sp. PT13 TaxID=3439547 RepID=UPI003EBDA0FD
MNFTKTAVIASAMLALSTQVFANNMDTMHATKVLQTKDVATKVAAYDLAFDQLETLQADSPSQLNRALGHMAPDSRSLSLEDGSYITVAEKMNANGNTSYTGLVNVNYSYQVND